MKILIILTIVVSAFTQNVLGQSELENCSSQFNEIVMNIDYNDSAYAKTVYDSGKNNWIKCLESKKIPELFLKSVSNKTVQIVVDSNKVYVLQFWMLWCPPCMAEISVINQLLLDYKDKNVAFITLGYNKSIEQGMINKFKSVFVPNCASISKELGVLAYPTIYIVSGDLKITNVFMGASDSNNDALYLLLKDSIDKAIITR